MLLRTLQHWNRRLPKYTLPLWDLASPSPLDECRPATLSDTWGHQKSKHASWLCPLARWKRSLFLNYSNWGTLTGSASHHVPPVNHSTRQCPSLWLGITTFSNDYMHHLKKCSPPRRSSALFPHLLPHSQFLFLYYSSGLCCTSLELNDWQTELHVCVCVCRRWVKQVKQLHSIGWPAGLRSGCPNRKRDIWTGQRSAAGQRRVCRRGFSVIRRTHKGVWRVVITSRLL